MSDDLHTVSVRISELAYRIYQAREKADGIPVATRFAQWAEDGAEKELHASNCIQRAVESQQQEATPANSRSKA